MVDVVTPDVDPGGHLLGLQDVLEVAGVGQGLFIPGPLAAADHDLAAAVGIQGGAIVNAWIGPSSD